MAIQLSLYLGISPSPFLLLNHSFSGDQSLFSGYFVLFNGRKSRNPLSVVHCSVMNQGLLRRPEPNQLSFDLDEIDEGEMEETLFVKPSSVFCSQIEKLVWCGRYQEALQLFEILESEGGHDVGCSTYDALVCACIELKSVKGAKMVRNHMMSSGFEPDLFIRNRVLRMHVKCGLIDDALKLFDEMPERDLVSWTLVIAGLVATDNYREAFKFFLFMWEKFSCTRSHKLTPVIRIMILACTALGIISVGRQLHSCALKIGVTAYTPVSCVLVDMYIKCGYIDDARRAFDIMPEKNIIGWSSIMYGYVLHGYSDQALRVLRGMLNSGVEMNHFTICIVISACARLASLDRARQAHAALIRRYFGLNRVISSALIDFYGKWGRISDARHVLEAMPPCKDIMSWSALIAGYAHHGKGAEAVEIFEQMLCEGMKPNRVTFLAVLSACSYSGLSELGWEIFTSMKVHKVKPLPMHYAHMIELLSRKGSLDEAWAFLKNAPCRPTENMWDALLTGARIHEDLKLGELAAEKLFEMETERVSSYIILLNIYNSSGKLKEAAKVLQTLKRKGLSLLPASSCIETRNQCYDFVSGDKTHVQTKEIYQKLHDLMVEISNYGYFPQKKFVLFDVDEQEKHSLMYHSEKLAVAFGLIDTPYWTPLRVVQSHRICDDCHNAIKLIALVTKREILVKDSSRFHHFKDGVCSCGEYW